MDEIDENTKKQIENAKIFKEALTSNKLIEHISKVEEALLQVKDISNKIPDATIDENKPLKDYDYYWPITKEFENIYKTLNYNLILNFFSKGPKLNVIEFKTKIKNANQDEKTKILDHFYRTIGLKAQDVASLDVNNLNPETFVYHILIELNERLINEPNFNKKLRKLYFADIDIIPRAIEEYDYISKQLVRVSDRKLYWFVVQLLYLKAYEGNLNVLRDAYTNETGKDVRSFGKKDDYYKSFNDFLSRHSILNEAMDKELRDSIAHNAYKKLDKYTPERVLELARRNFITSIIGISIKTNKLIDQFIEGSNKIQDIFRSIQFTS